MKTIEKSHEHIKIQGNTDVRLNVSKIGKAISSCIEIKIDQELIGAMQPESVAKFSVELFSSVLREIASNFDYEKEKDAALKKEKRMACTNIISNFIVHSGLDKLAAPGSLKQEFEKFKNETAKSTLH